MTQPQRILCAGDLHGDVQHTMYTFQKALDSGADAIVQVGDFGYWEHMTGGSEFLDFCSDLATSNAMPLYWVDGNHENHTMLRRIYGPGGDKHKLTAEGFWEIRDGVYYIPRGTRWEWNTVRMMGLGGAYSVDKFSRRELERKAEAAHRSKNNYRVKAGAAERPYEPEKDQRWWPEEELTDDEVAAAIADPEPIDILFTHDKPRQSKPDWNRKDLAPCIPNQDKIQTVVDSLHPKLIIHGHLHFRYTDYISNGVIGEYAQVEGLSCNSDSQTNEFNPELSWILITLADADEVP